LAVHNTDGRDSTYGKVDQPTFLNAVGKGDTGLTPEELLRALLDVEKKLGRTREFAGTRIIDLDILTYDNLVLHSEVLTVLILIFTTEIFF